MGQKVNPIGLRLGINKDWQSNWYADSKDVPKLLNTDLKLRKFLKTRLKDASVGNVTIERTDKNTEVTIFTSKPGVIIGQGGSEMKKLTSEIEKIVEGIAACGTKYFMASVAPKLESCIPTSKVIAFCCGSSKCNNLAKAYPRL